jgi:hypothetical protein
LRDLVGSVDFGLGQPAAANASTTASWWASPASSRRSSPVRLGLGCRGDQLDDVVEA